MRLKQFAPALLAGALSLGGLTRSAQAGGADLALLPGQGSVLMHIDLARLRGSSFYKEVLQPLLQTPKLQQDLNEAKTELGFDPVTDIDALTVLMAPPMGPGQDEEALVVVEGKINRDKLTTMATKDGGAVKAAHNGVDVWAAPPGKDDMALAFVNNKTLLGKQAWVKGAIDASQGKGAGLNAGLKALVDGVNKGGDMWIVANVPAEAQAELAKGNPMAKDLKTVSGSLDFAKGLAINFALGTSAEGAKAMADEIQKGLKLDPQTEPMMQQMGLLPIIKKLKVQAVGTSLNIGLDLDPAELNQLKALVGMMGMGMMGGGGGAAPMMPPPGNP